MVLQAIEAIAPWRVAVALERIAFTLPAGEVIHQPTISP